MENMLSIKKCNLCPRNCGVNRENSFGVCKSGAGVKLARAALHFWEEPCISGKGGSGTVFFSGCSLKCVYCQNYPVSFEGFGREVSVERLGEIFLELQEVGAENINLVSPTHYCLQIAEALDGVMKYLKIPVVYNTSGYESIKTLEFMERYVDIYLSDIKYFSPEISFKYSGAKDYFSVAEKAVREMINQKKCVYNESEMLKSGVIIRHLVLPSYRKDSLKILDFLNENFKKEDFILSLMSQYTPGEKTADFSEINRKTTTFEYNSVVDYARELGFSEGYIQQRSSADKIYTPPFDLTGV